MCIKKIFLHSNLLGGGLVSFLTLSESTTQSLNALSPGALVCIYEFSKFDQTIAIPADHQEKSAGNLSIPYKFYAVCWRGNGRTINVMCNRIG